MEELQAQKIVERYGDMIFRLALAITRHYDIAEDVYQEVFLRYVRKQPNFESEEHAKAWFLIVCKNCCRTHIMSAFVRHTTTLPDTIPMAKQQDYGLYHEVLKLPMNYRIIIHLYYYEGYATRDIANLLHKKDATVRSQLRRARAMLKVQLEGCDEFEIL